MNKDLKGSLTVAGTMLAVSFCAAFAKRFGYADHDTVTRLVVGMDGLMIVWLGNRMPKAFLPAACSRQVKRVGGWAMVLSGLVYTGLFVVAPIPVALTTGSATVVAGIAVTLGYCLSLRVRRRPTA